jgi:hypothetical protein
VSDAPRFLPRFRRAPAEVRPDYSEPDFSSWAAKLDAFVPNAAAPAKTEAVAPSAGERVPERDPEIIPETSARPLSGLNADLQRMLDFEGAMCVALADSESGMVLGQAGSGIDMERAAAGASMILRARRATVRALGLPDQIDDMLVTLTTQLHIIRPLAKQPTMFIYLVADRSQASLALARYKVTAADGEISL